MDNQNSETAFRDDLAKERTVLAYIRTALTLIAVGASFVAMRNITTSAINDRRRT